jgi:hypothetical protein
LRSGGGVFARPLPFVTSSFIGFSPFVGIIRIRFQESRVAKCVRLSALFYMSSSENSFHRVYQLTCEIATASPAQICKTDLPSHSVSLFLCPHADNMGRLPILKFDIRSHKLRADLK